MQIDRMIYPINSLGPGNRLAIWTIGCSKRCRRCANPELWQPNPDKETDAAELTRIIKRSLKDKQVDGITITGGDPLEQYKELTVFLPMLKEVTDDILLFTGFTMKEASQNIPCGYMGVIKKYVSVIIDGPYIDEKNNSGCVLRGSSNQNIIFFDEGKRAAYTEYINGGRIIQNVFYDGNLISVGIHNRTQQTGGKDNA